MSLNNSTFSSFYNEIKNQLQKEENKMIKEKEYVRLQNVMNKIKKGENVTIAAFGGSITTGYNSSPINKNSWAAITGQWFKDKAEESFCVFLILSSFPLTCFTIKGNKPGKVI